MGTQGQPQNFEPYPSGAETPKFELLSGWAASQTLLKLKSSIKTLWVMFNSIKILMGIRKSKKKNPSKTMKLTPNLKFEVKWSKNSKANGDTAPK